MGIRITIDVDSCDCGKVEGFDGAAHEHAPAPRIVARRSESSDALAMLPQPLPIEADEVDHPNEPIVIYNPTQGLTGDPGTSYSVRLYRSREAFEFYYADGAGGVVRDPATPHQLEFPRLVVSSATADPPDNGGNRLTQAQTTGPRSPSGMCTFTSLLYFPNFYVEKMKNGTRYRFRHCIPTPAPQAGTSFGGAGVIVSNVNVRRSVDFDTFMNFGTIVERCLNVTFYDSDGFRIITEKYAWRRYATVSDGGPTDLLIPYIRL